MSNSEFQNLVVCYKILFDIMLKTNKTTIVIKIEWIKKSHKKGVKIFWDNLDTVIPNENNRLKFNVKRWR